MLLEIRDVDPHDEPALRAWWEVGQAATAGRPGERWPAWEISRTMMRADNPEYDVTRFGAFDGEEMVASSISMLPLHDNLHACSLDVYVPPSRRREGIGTQLLADIEARATARGRNTLLCQAYVSVGEEDPAEQFARACGFEVANRQDFKELRLTDYRSRQCELLATVDAEAGDYRILTYDTVCPAEQLASFARLLGMMHSEMPTGDLDLHDSQWTTERLRAAENRRVSTGFHVLTALAIAPDGSVAGFTDVRIHKDDPRSGYNGVTLVDPAHRGHRLGLALKVASHDLALARFESLETVVTSNAEVNAHMSAVNEALGYRSTATALELQKKI